MLVTELFERIGHKWNIGGKRRVVQDADVTAVLDHAAVRLYDASVGDRIVVGGLIIEKRESGHDVYAYVGNYQ